MNTPVKPVANAASAAKARKSRKPPSGKRLAAIAAVDAAKSDQEKTVARSHLKTVAFEELARARVRRALKVLGTIENLANRAAYTWTDEQAKKILGHLGEKVDSLATKFMGGGKKAEDFDL